MSWSPDPGWVAIAGRHGPATVGVWVNGDRVIKRLRPTDFELGPRHAGYWRREAEVALHPDVVSGPGLVPTDFHEVAEDSEGITVVSGLVAGEPPTSLMVAQALGRFACSEYDDTPWMSRNLLADRLALAEQRGGWPTLRRTSIAELCAGLWERRHHWLEQIHSGPQGRVHGDPTPSNFLAQRSGDVVTVDWQCFGVGPIGSDLGYWALSSREDFDVLLDAFAGTHPDRAAWAAAARVMAAYTVVSRAELALAHADQGEGSLSAKLKHPSVRPHLRALQRQLPQIEWLLRA